MLKEAKENPYLTGLIIAALGVGGIGNLRTGLDADAVKAAENRLTKIEERLDQLVEHRETTRRFWALHGFSKDQINLLRAKHELDPASWPRSD
jgi:hypothetical protein